jgi:hypothetical protein
MRWPVAVLLTLGLVASGGLASSGFTALGKVERGQWQLREVGGETRSACIADPETLFQLRGTSAGCSRLVIENAPTSATVNYSCQSGAHGRTTISVETPRLMRIESQGVEAGVPFFIEIEARRTGAC